MVAFPFSSFVVVKTLCTDTAHTFIKHGSGALIDWSWEYWLSCDVGQRLESRRLLLDHVRMDPEQLVAQLAELRTQSQQLHQALQQVQQQQSQQQQQQSQQQSLVQALSDLPQSLAQTVVAAVLAKASPARANPTMVDTKGLGKPPPLKNTESEFVSWARRTENFVVSVHLGARDVLTWAVERESAATEVVMPLDTLRMLADQLYTVLMTLVEGESFDILVVSGSGEGLEAWQRLHKRWDPSTTGRAIGLLREIFSLDLPSWSSCKEQWNDWRT